MAKIAIIGGGVIGSSIAYYLALAGHTGDVVVIEPFCKQGGPVLDTSQARRVSGSWRMAAGRRRSARSRGSEGLCPSRIPKTAQRSASGVLDHR
jgi:glycine/D-amino acid oxidase-like deaminating enzyme